MIFTQITVFFVQNHRTKIHSWTGQMVCHMFKIIWTVSSRWFGHCKQNVFPRKRFVVRWSHSDFSTTQLILVIKQTHYPYHFKTNGILLTARSFCFFEINTWPLALKNFTILSQKIKRFKQFKVTWVDGKY